MKLATSLLASDIIQILWYRPYCTCTCTVREASAWFGGHGTSKMGTRTPTRDFPSINSGRIAHLDELLSMPASELVGQSVRVLGRFVPVENGSVVVISCGIQS